MRAPVSALEMIKGTIVLAAKTPGGSDEFGDSGISGVVIDVSLLVHDSKARLLSSHKLTMLRWSPELEESSTNNDPQNAKNPVSISPC